MRIFSAACPILAGRTGSLFFSGDFADDVAVDFVHADAGGIGDLFVHHAFGVVEEFFVGNVQTFFLLSERLAPQIERTEDGEDFFGVCRLEDLAVDGAAHMVVLNPVRLVVGHPAEKGTQFLFRKNGTHPSAERRISERNENGGGVVVNGLQDVIVVGGFAEGELFDG